MQATSTEKCTFCQLPLKIRVVNKSTNWKKMDSIVRRSFHINLRLMEVLRMYSPDQPTIFFKTQAYSLFTLLIPPVPILGTLFFLFGNDFTIAQGNDNAFLIAEMGSQVAKFLPFIANGSQIRRCIHYFESPLFTAHRSNQKEIIDKCVTICRRNSMIFLVSICAGIVFFATRPLFNQQQKFPADVWLPYNLVSEPDLFYVIYMYIVTGVGYASLACAAIDPLIGGLACLATGQLRVLKDNLQHVGEYAEEIFQENKNMGGNGKRKIIHDIIKHCVDHHNAILDFVAEYESSFSFSVFGQFLGSILVICFCCLQLTKLDPLSFNFISMITFLSVVLAQIYVYSYYGTLLFEETNSLTNAIYASNWYEYDMETKRALSIFMERGKKPLVITAGKIFELSIDTFAMILRRSYSLFAVLKNM